VQFLAPLRVFRVDWGRCNLDQDHRLATLVQLESTATLLDFPAPPAAASLGRIHRAALWFHLVSCVLRASIAVPLDLRSRRVCAGRVRFLAVVQKHQSARLALLDDTATPAGSGLHPGFALQGRSLRPEPLLLNASSALLASTATRRDWLNHLGTAGWGRFPQEAVGLLDARCVLSVVFAMVQDWQRLQVAV